MYRRLLCVAAALLVTSCVKPGSDRGAERNWPSSPNPTRIVWTGAAANAEDLHIGTGLVSSLWRMVTGGGEETIVRPYGIHADCRKRVLVVDSQKRGVHLFDRELKRYFFISGGEESVFNLPIGVTEDENNMAYVTDAGAGKVYRFSLSDRRLVQFTDGLQRPTGIVFNPLNKLLYVTDTLAAQVVVFDRQGKEVRRIGRSGHGRGEFNLPTDIAVDIEGKLYVTDPLNARIQIFSKDGVFLDSFGEAGDTPGFFGKAKGIAVNSEGHIYVCDALYDRVQVFDSKGRLLITFGSTGSGKGEFWMPSGIAIDKDDNIYIADTFNKRFQLFGYVWLD
ncbi:6-bladed beta-propeller [Geomonas oryzisoli]|uniref:6-bladed beta-propeller n=1 Tax=Geomonas oryzisoli TaxID=2847992 RepID=A0ABX8JBD6_9BACT|nr:6-bladed beta-propeller [Geomonas oryzisoli]